MKFTLASLLLTPTLTTAKGFLRGVTLHKFISDQKVTLKVYSESGCPNCQSLLSGDLKTVFDADGVVDILDFDFISFGNAYYLQSECPGYPDYDRTDGVSCYQKKCSDVSNAPDECFTGTIACQHQFAGSGLAIVCYCCIECVL